MRRPVSKRDAVYAPQVAFFLIIPAWLLCVLIGVVLACFPRLRRTGISLIAVSTGGTLISLGLSTAVLFLGPRLGFEHFGKWSGIALIGTYVIAIVAGGLIGSVSGFLLTRKLLPPKQLL
jgi:hypothetical protein